MCAKHIGFLIKPASSACNMRCRYCFYCDVAAHREERRDRQQVSWALQTNGYLIDGEWAEFFREHGFLIGVSVDAYRDRMTRCVPTPMVQPRTLASWAVCACCARPAWTSTSCRSSPRKWRRIPSASSPSSSGRGLRTSSLFRACPASTTNMTRSHSLRGSSRPSIVACSTCGGASWGPDTT